MSWFPELGLRDNPFQYNDFQHERQLGEPDFPRVKTEEIKRIKILARQTSGKYFIVGDRGVGKSTVLYMAVQDLKSKDKEDNMIVFSVVAPTSVVELYDKLFRQFVKWYKKEDKGTGETTIEEKISLLNAFFRDSVEPTEVFNIKRKKFIHREEYTEHHVDCTFWNCPYRKRCAFPLKALSSDMKKVNSEIVVDKLLRIDKYCALKVYLVQSMAKMALHYGFDQGKIINFLLDMPDELYKLEDFRLTLIRLSALGTLVLIATRKQYSDLTRLKPDTFSRFVKREFIQLKNKELRELYFARLDWLREKGEGKNYPPFLTEAAIDYVINQSVRNPRLMLKICHETLESVMRDDKSLPIGTEYVEKMSKTATQFSQLDLIRILCQRYISQKRAWVEVAEIRHNLKEQSGMNISSERLGRILTSLKLEGLVKDQRNAPRSQYLFYMGE